MTDLSLRLRSCGVVGAGGAGFPAYVKAQARAEIVIVNAAECEPLLHKDKELLTHYQAGVLEGLRQLMGAVGARRGIVAIKEKYATRIDALEKALVDEPRIEVARLGDFYPAGDEVITIFETTGRVVPPGGLPLDVGCVVSNVETLLNMARGEVVTHKYLTVAGLVPEPVTVRAPLGIRFKDLLAHVGVDQSRLGGVIEGGVMMGRLVEGEDEVVTRITGGLLCFPEGHGLLRRYGTDRSSRDLIGKSACDQCTFCTQLCPRYLLGHPVEPHLAMRGLEFNLSGDGMKLGSQFCSGCNLCSLYSCPEGLYPKDACTGDKQDMRAKGLEHPAKGIDTLPHSMREFRKIPVSSLMKKLDLVGFDNRGPLVDVQWAPGEISIPLSQHTGAPAIASVSLGDHVQVAQVIGTAPEGLGVPVHASMAGVVIAVDQNITIRTGL